MPLLRGSWWLSSAEGAYRNQYRTTPRRRLGAALRGVRIHPLQV